MRKKIAIIISPNWKDYAKKYLYSCIRSLKEQNYKGEIKIFITDNETSEESYALLKKMASEAKVIRNKNNDGFAKGNNDAIKEALKQGSEYIILFNMDTEIEKNCVNELVRKAESDKKIGAVQARLMLFQDKNKINSIGNSTHFLGFGYCLGYNKKISEIKKIPDQIFYPSGAAVLFKRRALEHIGLFDEKYWMYNEDQDLGWRVWLCGYKCVLAKDAVVYHKYEFAKSIKQYYWMDRNRIISILKNYRLATLLLILPAFIVMEFGLLLFSLKTGWFKQKLKIWRFFFNFKNWKYLIKARINAQHLRKIKDKDILKLISGQIWYQEIDDFKLKLINPIFNLYWNLIKKIIFW